MLSWARAWRLPHRGLGSSSPSFSRVPVAPSSSHGGTQARPVPLSYRLLDGEAAHPPLVFLHGLFGCKANFNSVAKALAQQTGRRVLTVDARNHGDSPHSPDMSYEAMSQDLQDLLPQLGLVPCVLIGHSMGGRTAMLLALQRPELVERLIAVDISPVESTSSSNFPRYVAAMRAVDIPEEASLSSARKLADEKLSSVIQRPPAGLHGCRPRLPGLRVAGQRGHETPGLKAPWSAPFFCTEGLRWALRGQRMQRGSDLKL
ncbi:protein ABHD11 isoform X4 [Hippopotamus amphibius kiboko]|uniref:protein ABHD11 isoform X4 n=1 Tax=Hippopotamus amphibius kiboko TaxID=575201 RepID=UPI0025927FE4|nr:protein ABHD11 isoform X4 [Hippopotamus amphibius kiboko]